MNTEQLKNLVIDRISEIEDESFLQAIKVILDRNTASSGIFRLTDEQKQKVAIGLSQIESGQTITNDDLEKEEDEWLKK